MFTVHASHGIQMLTDSVKELIEIRLSLIVERRGFFVFPRKKISLFRIVQGESWILGDHQFITGPKALRLSILIRLLLHESLNFV